MSVLRPASTTVPFELPLIGPVDDHGRLLHEDDPAAQLALAVRRLEQALARHEAGLADVRHLTVATVHHDVFDGVADVLTERLVETRARPGVDVVERTLPLPGMLLALAARAHVTVPPLT